MRFVATCLLLVAAIASAQAGRAFHPFADTCESCTLTIPKCDTSSNLNIVTGSAVSCSTLQDSLALLPRYTKNAACTDTVHSFFCFAAQSSTTCKAALPATFNARCTEAINCLNSIGQLVAKSQKICEQVSNQFSPEGTVVAATSSTAAAGPVTVISSSAEVTDLGTTTSSTASAPVTIVNQTETGTVLTTEQNITTTNTTAVLIETPTTIVPVAPITPDTPDMSIPDSIDIPALAVNTPAFTLTGLSAISAFLSDRFNNVSMDSAIVEAESAARNNETAEQAVATVANTLGLTSLMQSQGIQNFTLDNILSQAVDSVTVLWVLNEARARVNASGGNPALVWPELTTPFVSYMLDFVNNGRVNVAGIDIANAENQVDSNGVPIPAGQGGNANGNNQKNAAQSVHASIAMVAAVVFSAVFAMAL